MIADLAKRLGINSERTIRKAQEFQRLVQLKTSASSGFHIKGTGYLVICLELASKAEHVSVDKELCLKLSGMKKPQYNSTKQTLMQLLGLFQELSTKDLCLQFGCPEIMEQVDQLIDLYRIQSCNGQTDIDHPGFKAAAVAALSKIQKFSIDRQKLHELSGLKKNTFDKLTASLIALYQQHDPQKEKTKGNNRKRPYSFVESVEEKAKTLEEETRNKGAIAEDQQFDFAAWKQRMLEEAKSDG